MPLSDGMFGFGEREMRKSLLLAATAITAISVPAYAQNDRADVDDNIIIVTAQRQAQSA